MPPFTDTACGFATPVHEVTADNVVEYLQQAGLISGPASAEALGWGVSNVVLRVTPDAGAPLVVKQSRELLRTRAEWRSRLDRIWREADVLRLLEQIVPGAAPRLLHEDRPNYLLVMEAIDRDHVVWKEALLNGRIDLSLAETLGTLLARIHTLTWHNPTVAELMGNAEAFDELRLDPYYRRLASVHPSLAPILHALIEASRTRRHALVLADFSPKNILLTADGLTLVDFETGHYGDPPFDLGFFLTHIALKGVRAGRGDDRCFLLAQQFWKSYADAMTPLTSTIADFEPLCVRHWTACLLARVDGKSPVDYLDEPQQALVREFALKTRLSPADRMPQALAALQARVL
ncbi:MAG: phosphotransferase [Planctomycetaceae bacterium]|nr:phosphotransferase [Planctomycetaceae bacterium]